MVPRLLDQEIEERLRRRPKGEREALSGAISGVARILLDGSSAEIAALERELRKDDGGVDSFDELEARNKLHVFARYRETEERSLSGSELQEGLGAPRRGVGAAIARGAAPRATPQAPGRPRAARRSRKPRPFGAPREAPCPRTHPLGSARTAQEGECPRGATPGAPSAPAVARFGP